MGPWGTNGLGSLLVKGHNCDVIVGLLRLIKGLQYTTCLQPPPVLCKTVAPPKASCI